MLIVTYKCNLHCTYCYEPKSLHKMMTPEQAKSYIKRAVDSLDGSYDGFEVQFMGGEPLVEFSFIKEVSEWLWAQNWKLPLAQIFAATNGTLLDSSMKQWFSINRKRICLGLSFDGSRLMQNLNRSGSYDDVDLGFFASTWPRQSVKMTVSPDTVSHLYDGVMHLYANGLKNVAADLAVGRNVRWKQNHLGIFSEQLQKLADYYVAHPDCPRISFLDMDVTAVLSEEKRLKHCGCGEQLVCIDCDGAEYACHLFSPVSASPRQAEDSRNIDFTDESLFASEECRKCLLINVCTRCCGMNYQCQGDVAKPASFSCAAFRMQFAVTCSMLLRMAESYGDKEEKEKIRKVMECLTDKS